MTSTRIEYSIPILETGRTILRAPQLKDFEESAAMWGDPNVTAYIAPKPFTRSETWARFLRYHSHWQYMGFGFWMVEEKQSGNFIGEVGFMEHHRNVVPKHEGIPEAGWVLKPEFHGKGLATEVMKAALQWADQNLDCEHTICLFDDHHDASLNVAKKLGYDDLSQVLFENSSALTMKRARQFSHNMG